MKTPQEYREKISRESLITLPSGLECSIRAVPTMKILELTMLAEKEAISLNDWILTHFIEALDTVVPSSVVYPRINASRKPDEPINPDALTIDELVIGDLNTLFREIMLLSGITKEEIAEQAAFREQPAG